MGTMGIRSSSSIPQQVTLNLILTLSLVYPSWAAIFHNYLFPFGVESGDTAINTDLFVEKSFTEKFGATTYTQLINFSEVAFPFMGQNYNHIYVVPGLGRVSFHKDWQPRFDRCDRGYLAPGVDVFSSDLGGDSQQDPDSVGRDVVFYRESRDKQLLNKLAQDIRAAYELDRDLEWMFIVTWKDVRPRFERMRENICDLGETKYRFVCLPANTFQLTLTTNGNQSFAIFNYNQLNWTSSDIGEHNIGGHNLEEYNGDCNGLNGAYPASAGIGWTERYFALPGSCSDEILNLARNSNIIDRIGRWVYRVDGGKCFSRVNAETHSHTVTFSPSQVTPLDKFPVKVDGACLYGAKDVSCTWSNANSKITTLPCVNLVFEDRFRNPIVQLYCEMPEHLDVGRYRADIKVTYAGDMHTEDYVGHLTVNDTEIWKNMASGDQENVFQIKFDEQTNKMAVSWNMTVFEKDLKLFRGVVVQFDDVRLITKFLNLQFDPLPLDLRLSTWSEEEGWKDEGFITRGIPNEGYYVANIPIQTKILLYKINELEKTSQNRLIVVSLRTATSLMGNASRIFNRSLPYTEIKTIYVSSKKASICRHQPQPVISEAIPCPITLSNATIGEGFEINANSSGNLRDIYPATKIEQVQESDGFWKRVLNSTVLSHYVCCKIM